MKKLVWTVLIALVVLGLFTGAERASAANGFEECTYAASVGCCYYWDGFATITAARPRSEAGSISISRLTECGRTFSALA